MFVSAMLVLAGCSPDLRVAEKRQKELEIELAELDREVLELRSTLEDAGIEVKGKGRVRAKAKGRGRKARPSAPPEGANQTPTRERTADAGVAIERTGTPIALSIPGAPERVETTACGYRLEVPSLKGISDYPLNSRGLGKSGPVLLELDGVPLEPHALPADFEQRCGGAFRHAGTVVLFAPPEPVELGSRVPSLSLDPRVPVPRGDDGRPMYWVYPGTELVVRIDRWDPSWGPAEASVVALVMGPGSATFDLDGAVSTGAGATNLTESLDGAGPFTLKVRSDPDGPFVLLDALTIGNPDDAVVVTGGQAWRAAH
ncbi:MAG: hypothetical protein R3F61_35530 [Myxococcota bacterium]